MTRNAMTLLEQIKQQISQEHYVDPTTDFGFKLLFASEEDKIICIDMLNCMLELEGDQAIKDLTFVNTEFQADTDDVRQARVDVHAITEKRENIVIEMQSAPQHFYVDRILFYLMHTLLAQVPKGEKNPWNYQVARTYMLSFCNFELEQERGNPDHLHVVQRTNVKTKRVWSKLVTEVYVELPKFTKSKEELTNRQDQWVYLIKHLPEMTDSPTDEPDEVFQRFKVKGFLGTFSKEQMDAYTRARFGWWDYKNQLAYAEDMGEKRGITIAEARAHQEKLQMAQTMLADGMPLDQITKYTGLAVEDINVLRIQ